MVRTPSFDKNGIKKGAWSPEEDRKLEAYITRYGHWNWRELPKFAGLQRCGKSCRLRWMNYLRPNVRRGNYTKDEEDLIMELHQKHGNKWAMIAGRLPGRTDNEIKNHWHTHLKKRWRNSPASDKSSSATDSTASDSERSVQRRASSRVAAALLSANPAVAEEECFRHIKILESCPLSPPPPAADDCYFAGPEFTPLGVGGLSLDPVSSSSSINSAAGSTLCGTYDGLDLEADDDFWTRPFSLEDMMSSYDYSTADNHHLFLSTDHYYQTMADLFSHQDQIIP